MGTIRLLSRSEHNCPCSFVVEEQETGRTLPFQFDGDWPSLARNFGWIAYYPDPSMEIRQAGEFLDSQWGETTEDPGYFANQEDAS